MLMEGKENPMREVRMDKLVINIGTGSDEQKQANAKSLLANMTKRKPVDEISRKRIPSFKISKGTKIGAYVTLREDAKPLAKRLLAAVDNKLKRSSISNNTVSFGIREYIDIEGVKYDPKVGMLGMNVNLSLKRRGMRVAIRKIKARHVSKRHGVVSKGEVEEFLNKEFGVQIIE